MSLSLCSKLLETNWATFILGQKMQASLANKSYMTAQKHKNKRVAFSRRERSISLHVWWFQETNLWAGVQEKIVSFWSTRRILKPFTSTMVCFTVVCQWRKGDILVRGFYLWTPAFVTCNGNHCKDNTKGPKVFLLFCWNSGNTLASGLRIWYPKETHETRLWINLCVLTRAWFDLVRLTSCWRELSGYCWGNWNTQWKGIALWGCKMSPRVPVLQQWVLCYPAGCAPHVFHSQIYRLYAYKTPFIRLLIYAQLACCVVVKGKLTLISCKWCACGFAAHLLITLWINSNPLRENTILQIPFLILHVWLHCHARTLSTKWLSRTCWRVCRRLSCRAVGFRFVQLKYFIVSPISFPFGVLHNAHAHSGLGTLPFRILDSHRDACEIRKLGTRTRERNSLQGPIGTFFAEKCRIQIQDEPGRAVPWIYTSNVFALKSWPFVFLGRVRNRRKRSMPFAYRLL